MPTLKKKKSFFERKTDLNENERHKRNSINNINTLIPKNYEKVMNSENAVKKKDTIGKELQKIYGNNVIKICEKLKYPRRY